MLQVAEIFKSIQGESSHAGLPCAFVRLTGCHLRCVWCDTQYAFYGGRPMSQDSILETVDALGLKLVEVTGGEPLLQAEVYPLLQAFLDGGYTVLLETSGAILLDRVPPGVIKIVDLKCPGSGEVEKNCYANLDLLGGGDEVKFVIADRADYEWCRDIIARHRLHEKAGILVSTVYGQLELKDLADWVLQDGLPVRMQTQLHKLIWGQDAIGV